MPKLNYLSIATTPIEVLAFNGVKCGQATGFFYRGKDNDIYLITNWHVVTGRDPVNPSFSKTGAVPCTLRCKLHKKTAATDAVNITQIKHMDVTINTEDGDSPEWLEHDIHNHLVDVVAIKIENVESVHDECKFHILNECQDFQKNFNASVMDTVIVVGYPWGLTGGGQTLPIYKRGSLATEPDVPYGGLPRVLIDCRTTEAMSGSPVIVSHSGVWNPSGGFAGDSTIGTVTNFLGVYSGRLKSKENDAPDEKEISQLGVVWKKETVDAIAYAGVVGTTLTKLSGM